jgi:3-hydroxyacyl-[acyl-carrier-protein] dehydratase
MGVVFNVEEIKALIPHRQPFLLVDRVIELTDSRIVGEKYVSINEDFFRGHFPDVPIMPGVLQVEALAQTAGIYTMYRLKEEGKGEKERIGLFTGIDGVKFKQPVLPGSVLRLEVDVIVFKERLAKFRGVALLDGKEACIVNELMLMVMDKDYAKKKLYG